MKPEFIHQQFEIVSYSWDKYSSSGKQKLQCYKIHSYSHLLVKKLGLAVLIYQSRKYIPSIEKLLYYISDKYLCATRCGALLKVQKKCRTTFPVHDVLRPQACKNVMRSIFAQMRRMCPDFFVLEKNLDRGGSEASDEAMHGWVMCSAMRK